MLRVQHAWRLLPIVRWLSGVSRDGTGLSAVGGCDRPKSNLSLVIIEIFGRATLTALYHHVTSGQTIAFREKIPPESDDERVSREQSESPFRAR